MPHAMVLDRFDAQQAASSSAARHIAAALEAGIGARGAASFVATGGRTPGPVYAALHAAPLDWSRVWVTLSDERWVDETSPDSNAGLVRRLLLKGPAAAARFVGLKTGHGTPEAAADEVEARLASMPYPFDMVMLGMGDDGHVASLFPCNPNLAAAMRSGGLCMAMAPGPDGLAPTQPRMSLTLEAINAARAVLIYITGEDKWAVLQRALAGDDRDEMPVRAVLSRSAPVRVIWAP